MIQVQSAASTNTTPINTTNSQPEAGVPQRDRHDEDHGNGQHQKGPQSGSASRPMHLKHLIWVRGLRTNREFYIRASRRNASPGRGTVAISLIWVSGCHWHPPCKRVPGPGSGHAAGHSAQAMEGAGFGLQPRVRWTLGLKRPNQPSKQLVKVGTVEGILVDAPDVPFHGALSPVQNGHLQGEPYTGLSSVVIPSTPRFPRTVNQPFQSKPGLSGAGPAVRPWAPGSRPLGVFPDGQLGLVHLDPRRQGYRRVGGYRLHVPPQCGGVHSAAQQGQDAGRAPESDEMHRQVGDQCPEGYADIGVRSRQVAGVRCCQGRPCTASTGRAGSPEPPGGGGRCRCAVRYMHLNGGRRHGLRAGVRTKPTIREGLS